MSIYQFCNGVSNIPSDFSLFSDDPSLNDESAAALAHEYQINAATCNALFLSAFGLNYISEYVEKYTPSLRILSLPRATNTCYEKADLLAGWNPLNVIKAFYLESPIDQSLYAVIVPETGCFLNRKKVARQLNFDDKTTLSKAKDLPEHMTFGTCSPFIQQSDLLSHGGRVKKIIFDTETLVLKRQENTLDDFSFGSEHRLSLQMNYYQCYKMLKHIFPEAVTDTELLSLSFKEKLVRKKGKIKIDYEFESLNYRTAQFINENHGYGDVSIVNDHMDELFIPDVLGSVHTNLIHAVEPIKSPIKARGV